MSIYLSNLSEAYGPLLSSHWEKRENPQHYDEEQIPMSDMLRHLIMFYKYGGKQLYYFNTYDGSGEIDVDRLNQGKSMLIESVDTTLSNDTEDCDSCKI